MVSVCICKDVAESVAKSINQYVEFAGLDDEEPEDSVSENGGALGLHLPNPNAQKANAQRGNSLEVLLATKNKRILEELTKFRVCFCDLEPIAIGFFSLTCHLATQILHGELEASLQSVQSELAMTSSELEKQRALNEKLENDLLQMQAHNPKTVVFDAVSEDPDVLAGLDLGKKTVCSGLSRPGC